VLVIGYEEESDKVHVTDKEKVNVTNVPKGQDVGGICGPGSSVYVCRFLECKGSSSYQIVRNQSIFKR
jgi:hypothetical protein